MKKEKEIDVDIFEVARQKYGIRTYCPHCRKPVLGKKFFSPYVDAGDQKQADECSFCGENIDVSGRE